MGNMEWFDYESGENLNVFRESQPFVVDGIIYRPPPLTTHHAPINPMFRLKSDYHITFAGVQNGRQWTDQIPIKAWSDAKDFPGLVNITELENDLIDA